MLRSWDTRDGARVSVPALTLLDDLAKSFLPLGLGFLNCLMGTPIFACLAIVKPESIHRNGSFTRASRTKIQSFPQEIWAGWLGSWARGVGGGVAEGRMGQTEGQWGAPQAALSPERHSPAPSLPGWLPTGRMAGTLPRVPSPVTGQPGLPGSPRGEKCEGFM